MKQYKNNGIAIKKSLCILSVVLFLVIVGMVFVSMFYKTNAGERDIVLPKELTVKLTPDSLETKSEPGQLDIYNGIRQIDDMTREMYCIEVESSQGGNQVKMFFSRKSWEIPWNRNVYLLSFVAVFIAMLFLYKYSHRELFEKGLPLIKDIARQQHYLIPFALLTVVFFAMINISMPYNLKHSKDADPFFVFVTLFVLTLILYLLARVFRMTRNPKYWSTSFVVRRSHRTNTLMWAALTGWLLGFLCFFIGMYAYGTQESLLACLLRPALSATKMFVMADSPGELSYVFRHNGLFMGFYSLVKVYVLFVTSVSILSLVWYRVSGYLSLKYANAKGRELFVFFGVGENVRVLASSIPSVDDACKKPFLLFVESKEGSEETFTSSPSVGNFIQMFVHRRDSFNVVEQFDGYLLLTKTSVHSPAFSERISAYVKEHMGTNLWEDLDLSKLLSLVLESDKVHMLLLDDDEQLNIHATENILRLFDTTAIASAKDITIYCHANVDTVGNSFDVASLTSSNRLRVRILDSSELSIQTLLMDKHSTYHPVNFVKVNTANATVESDFNAWVLGFGQTGQQAVRFLYEFGAFLPKECGGKESVATHRSPFRCDIFDKNIMSLAADFLMSAPAVVPVTNFVENSIKEEEYCCKGKHLCFHQGFPNFLDTSNDSLIGGLSMVNYFVLAMGSDEQNMTVLRWLMEAIVLSRRKNYKNLIVLIRNYQKENLETMRCVEEYYNNLLECSQKPVVKVFGEREKLFSYDVVIQDTVEKNAITFYDKYREIEGSSDSWEKRNDVTERGRKLLWEAYKNVRRKIRQDKNNYIHIATKLQLIGVGPNELGDVSNQKRVKHYGSLIDFVHVKDFVVGDNVVSTEKGFKRVQLLGEEELLTNLAKTEHLRWYASHEMLGYATNDGTSCDELARTHNCLVSWEQLDYVSKVHNANEVEKSDKDRNLVDYKAYDFMVVKTTFELITHKNGTQTIHTTPH